MNSKITIIPNKAIEIVVPGLQEITIELERLYQKVWPLPVWQSFEINTYSYRFAVFFRAGQLSRFEQNTRQPMTIRCTAEGSMLDEFTWKWINDELKSLEVLRELAGISAWSEQYSFMETGGSCYTLFEVDDVWREVGFVTDAKVKYLLLTTDQQGFEDYEEYTQEEYEEFVEWVEKEQEEDDDTFEE